MSRIRTIKPEFWKHEDLSELPPETHMLAAALLNYADDEGYFNANPKLIQAECCPLRDDSTTVRRSIELLSSIGYIRLFEGADGKSYGHVVKFAIHQRVDRPKESKIKELELSTNNRRTIDEQSSLEGKGKEQGKEEERKGKDRSQMLAWFESLWDSFSSDYGEKGSKKTAQTQFEKINPDQQLFDEIMNGLSAQIRQKQMQQSAGAFCAPFQHVERWLKNRRWEDEISLRIVRQRDTRDKAAIAADAAFGADFDDSILEGDFAGVDQDGAAEQPDARHISHMGAGLVRVY